MALFHAELSEFHSTFCARGGRHRQSTGAVRMRYDLRTLCRSRESQRCQASDGEIGHALFSGDQRDQGVLKSNYFDASQGTARHHSHMSSDARELVWRSTFQQAGSSTSPVYANLVSKIAIMLVRNLIAIPRAISDFYSPSFSEIGRASCRERG